MSASITSQTKKNRIRRNAKKQKRRNTVRKIREDGQCLLCPIKEGLTFHHTNPSEKRMTVSSAVSYSGITLKRELAKCILLCVKCHRYVHMIRGRRRKQHHVY